MTHFGSLGEKAGEEGGEGWAWWNSLRQQVPLAADNCLSGNPCISIMQT